MLRMPEEEISGVGIMGITELAEVQGLQALHGASIEQVIMTMRDSVGEPLTLDDMADMACLSPYYFCRIFHQVIGIPPGEFLALQRLEAAKRLLLTTSMSVTDICFEVGYSGLGSFTTRFTQLVGVSPGQLRRLVMQPNSKADSAPVATAEQVAGIQMADAKSGVRGRIYITHPFMGIIFIGLFPKPIPQGRPVRCTHLFTPGAFHIDAVPDGRYYLMVAAMPFCDDPNAFLMVNDAMRVGAQGPLTVRNGGLDEAVDVVLRPPRVTDPPIISALPYL